ncbi:CHAT domain-containing protein [Saccharothrix deserti]|uniref:CHAT domain-containing protein n=1 Tax=Saccharothrix deserti TaxID=2593674 RepID=UPI00131C4C3B|nr:CHAT domain-containing protein [Saccharothrix deserti]
MRGERARAAVTDRVDNAPDWFLAAIDDDPVGWVALADSTLDESTVDRPVLDVVAALMRFTLTEISPRHPLREKCLRLFAVARINSAQYHGDEEAYTEFETVVRFEAEHLPDHDPMRARLTGMLDSVAAKRRESLRDDRIDEARALLDRFEATEDEASLDEAIARYRAVILDIAEESDKRGPLGSLGLALVLRYQLHADPGDLRAAIAAWRRALVHTSGNNARVQLVANLAGALHNLFDLERDEAVREEAFQLMRSVQDEGEAEMSRLNNLAAGLVARFAETGDTRAADEAIGLHERAIAMTDPADPQYASRLHNLSELLNARFPPEEHPAVVDRSIELSRRAYAAENTPPRQRFTLALALAASLSMRYKQSADLASLEEAVTLIRVFVANGPRLDPDRPFLLGKASLILSTYYDATRDPAVAREAAAVAREALHGLRHDHPHRPMLLFALSHVLSRVHHHTRDQAALVESRRLVAEAAALPDQSPLDRAGMLVMVAEECTAEQRWAEAADAYGRAIGLFPMLVSRRLTRGDQELRLAERTATVRDAGAVALQAGSPEQALALIEYGRGTLFAQSLENRDDFEDLHAEHPDLARELLSLRDTLATWTAEGAAVGDDHHRLARRWEELVAQVREIPGQQGFLGQPQVAELLSAAERGPVVVFSISHIRSDALIVRPDGIEVVPLPGVTPDVVERNAREFLAAVADGEDGEDGEDVTDILGWLWDAVAKPVLDHLPDNPSQRVWWCPTGSLAFLPLHAAGRDGHGVLDRVVSSGTSTIRALLHARRAGTSPGTDTLVVAVPRAEGVPPLPGVEREVALLEDILPATTVLRDARRAEVLAQITRYGWAHFACHAFTDTAHPSESRLLLADEAPLTVTDIARLRLDADLAHLSACSTATVGSVLPDEAIHLASAFQLAGYRHVVATLWPVRDAFTSRFARDFYAVVTEHGADSAATAVHLATRRLRDRLPDHPEIWAAHIHTGP